MLAAKAFFFFTLERIRCALLALATIILLKATAVLVLAPAASMVFGAVASAAN